MLKTLLLVLIRSYQLLVSSWLTANCRYFPSCSEYALQALNKYGTMRGLSLTVRRILRCHPWGGSGHDPLP